MANALTPAFGLELDAVDSGSTIIANQGKILAFYSVREGDGPLKFWKVEFNDEDL